MSRKHLFTVSLVLPLMAARRAPSKLASELPI